MPFSRGEVVLALFPDSNLKTAKKRPVIVLQRDALGTGLAQTIVAMITSNLARGGHPSRVTVLLASNEGKAAGFVSDSVIMTDNIATLRDIEIDRQIGSMVDMTAVDAALRHTLGL
jgi:mRNA interferase MazF